VSDRLPEGMSLWARRMHFDSTERENHIDRKLWLMFLGRLVVIILALGVLLLYNLGSLRGDTPHYPVAVLIFAAFLNVLYLLFGRVVRHKRALAATEITLDIIITAALVYLTGGLDSLFGIIFFACMSASSIMLTLSASLAFASLATVLLFGIAVAYVLSFYAGVQPWLVDSAWYSIILENTPITRLANLQAAKLLVFSGALYLVAVLSGQLAQRLRGEIILKEEILENVGDGIIVLDSLGKVLYVSRRAREILGEDESSLLMARGAPSGHLKDVVEMIGSGGAESEAVVEDVGKRSAPVHVMANTLYTARGRLRGVIITVRDLTEQKRMEAVERKADRLDLMRRMSAAIAHEIRNPIASIRGAAAELGADAAASDIDREMFRVIVEESDRTEKIVTNYLKYARLPNAELHGGDLVPAIEDAVSALRTGYLGSGHSIKLDTSARLPARFDADQMKQVFVNLGMNALQHMPGGGLLHVAAGIQRPPASVGSGRMITVRFIDEGEGIDAAVRRRMFQPFVTTRAAGSGMGLTIVETIVHTHGGAVTAENNPNRGATFTVWIPLVLPEPKSLA